MAEYDGSLKFDTSLDNSGFESDSAKLLKAIDNLTKAINSMGQQMGSAFQGAGPAIKGVASAAKSGAETATAATDKYTAALDKQQAKIDALKAKMSDYYAQKAEIEKSTDEALRQAQTDEQAAHIMEIESIQLDELNQKYAKQLTELQALEAEYNRLAEAKDAAGQAAETGGQTSESHGVGQAGDAAEQSGEKAQKSSKMWAALGSAIGATGKKALSAAWWFAKLPFKALASSVKSFVSNLRQSVSPTDNLVKSLTSLKTMLISRVKRTFISDIFNQAKESLRALALFSGDFNAAMSSIQNSSKQTAGNLAVSIGGAIQALQPVISGLISLINSAIVAINKLFALLGGKSTMTVAKQQTDDYAKSLSGAGGAAKEAAKQLAAFDELNILQDQQSGGGGGAADAADTFEEIELEEKFDSWGEALNAFLDDVLAKIPQLEDAFLSFDAWMEEFSEKLYDAFTFPSVAEKVEEIGRELAGAFNTLVANFPWDTVGSALGAGLNLALLGLVSVIYSFDWMQLGDGIAQSINGIVVEIDFTEVGQLLFSKFKIALDFLAGLILGLDMPQLAKAAGNIVIGFFDSMSETLDNIPWGEIGQKISYFLTNIPWGEIGKSVANSFNSIIAALRNFISGLSFADVAMVFAAGINRMVAGIEWGDAGALLSDAVKGLLDFIVTGLEEIDWQQLGNSIAEFIGSIDWGGILERLAEGVGAALGGLAALLWGLFGDALQELWDYFAEWTDKCGGDIIAGLLAGIANAIANIATWIYDHIFKPFIDGFKKAFGIASPSTVMEEQGNFVIEGLLQGITNAWNSITEFFSTALETVKGVLSDAWEAITSTVEKAWNGIKSFFSTTWNGISDTAKTVWNHVSNFFSDTWENIKTKAIDAWENVKKNVTKKFNAAKTSLVKAADTVKTKVSGAWDNVKKKSTDVWNNVKKTLTDRFNEAKKNVTDTSEKIFTTIGDKWDDVKKSADTKWNDIKSTISGLWNNLKTTLGSVKWNDIGENLVNGIKDGITRIWSNLVSTVTGLADGLTSTVKKIFGINSPSKEWAEIGKFLGGGLEKGIDGEDKTVTAAAESLAKSVTTAMSTGIEKNMTLVAKSVGNMAKSVISAANTALNIGASGSYAFNQIGYYIVSGLANGITSNSSVVSSAVRTVVQNAKTAAEQAAKVASPSKVFAKIGGFLSLGLAQGIENEEGAVLNSVSDLAHDAAKEMSDSSLSASVSGVDAILTSFSNRITDGIFTLVDTLQAIADNVTFRMPEIATGTVLPYRVAAAANAAPSGGIGNYGTGGTVMLDDSVIDILENILQAARANRDVYIDGRRMAKSVERHAGNMARAGSGTYGW